MVFPPILELPSSEERCAAPLWRACWLEGVKCLCCVSHNAIRWCRYDGCWKYMCKGCVGPSTIRLEQYSTIQGSALGHGSPLITLFMLIHTSISSISWLLGALYMTGVRASKRILFKFSQPLATLRGNVEIEMKFTRWLV